MASILAYPVGVFQSQQPRQQSRWQLVIGILALAQAGGGGSAATSCVGPDAEVGLDDDSGVEPTTPVTPSVETLDAGSWTIPFWRNSYTLWFRGGSGRIRRSTIDDERGLGRCG